MRPQIAQRSRLPRRPPYLDSQAGWRALFIIILVAAIFGLSFRLYFSPARLKAWVTTAINEQKHKSAHPFAVSFDRAEVSLARGWWPEFAVVLSQLKIAPSSDCRPEASIFIGRLRLPIRLRSLALGRAAIGVIRAEDLKVDLDELRAKCDVKAAAPAASSASVEEPPQLKRPDAFPGEPAHPWWTDDQFEKARANVEGIEFSRATLQFEGRQKEIYLDSFEALFKSDGHVRLETDVRIPPAAAYNEAVPPLRIEGDATSEIANLLISVHVSEGSLVSKAKLTPAKNQTLKIETDLTVENLPLSMMTPLMRKSGLADQNFNPKFLWLNCIAKISGEFQGLFQKSPLHLSNCRIEGDGTNILLNEATRTPDGLWSPFVVDIGSLDVAKLLSTIGVRGPDGIVAQFGRLQGQVKYQKTNMADFNGTLRDVALSFSSESVRSLQKIQSVSVALSMASERVSAVLDQARLENGEMAGSLTANLDRHLTEGKIELDLQRLVFDPAIQSLLVRGQLGPMSGSAKAKLMQSRITDFVSNLKLSTGSGDVVRFEGLDVSAKRQGDDPPKINFEAREFAMNQASKFFRSFQPAFFGHRFQSAWVTLKKFRAETTLLGASEPTVFEWSPMTASLEDGQIQVISRGSFNPKHELSGSLQIDFPAVKKLIWKLSGTTAAPLLSDQTESLSKFKSRVEFDDAALGMKAAVSPESVK